jgi:hypothetical protein
MDGSVWFHWNTDGGPVWQSERVAGPGSAARTPAIVRTGNGTMIAAYSPLNSGETLFYWNNDGSSSWQNCALYSSESDPAMAAAGASVESLAVTVQGRLWAGQDDACVNASSGLTSYANGQPPPFDLSPAMTRSSSGTVGVADYFGMLWFLWHFDSDSLNFNWYSAPVGNAISNSGTPAITRFGYGTEIASAGYDGSLWFYWNVDGTPAWNSSQIAAASSGTSASPAIARFANGTVVASTRRDGSMWFYWNVDGTLAWNSSEIAASGGVTSPPAMTRSSGGTEIAAIT